MSCEFDTVYDCKCCKIECGTITIIIMTTMLISTTIGFILGGIFGQNLPIFILGISMSVLIVFAVIYLVIWTRSNLQRNEISN